MRRNSSWQPPGSMAVPNSRLTMLTAKQVGRDCFMRLRATAYALLLQPAAAHAQFSLLATQVGPSDHANYTSYNGICSTDACRDTLPVLFDGVPCVLNVRVSAPNRFGRGHINFAAGPCRGGFQIRITPYFAGATYQTDRFGASSGIFHLELEPRTSSGSPDDPPALDDGVVRPTTNVELDIIATQRP